MKLYEEKEACIFASSTVGKYTGKLQLVCNVLFGS